MTTEIGWDCLLSLDGVTMVVDERLGFWVKFVARVVPKSEAVPHGVNYSLTLHDRRGSRVLGFDNAHRAGKQEQFDHWHRSSSDLGRCYAYESPEKLLADFWLEVDRVLKESSDD
ncbi:DUF6516 family protein [Azonexus sp.]|uniref:toxin-antitoxin system TumE family protein n=1 Tax=Azonexus sp. TaxID=1872668 RepID=UPI0039E2D183